MTVVTAKSGYDLGYVWRQQGRAPERSTGGYYINAAQAGEAPGRWFGKGAEALGLAEGSVVDRRPFMAVYSQRHPGTGEQLGRAPRQYAKFEDHLQRLLAAEPHATAERRLELEREAHRLTRETAPYTDATVSLVKSISVLHGSIRENERRAHNAGDAAAAAWWAQREERYSEILQKANRAALEHADRWTTTRTGYHGKRIDGQEPGKYEPAGLIVSSWLQGTSRDGDPQDHVHNLIARMALTAADGKWRAVDTMVLREQLPAMNAIASTYVECALAREFGVEWAPRPDGLGNEIRGITQAQRDAYSTRTQTIKEKTPEFVRDWMEQHGGREPNSRELLFIQNAVTQHTRAHKDKASIDWRELAEKWDATLGGELARIAPSVAPGLRGPGAEAAPGAGAEPAGPSGAELARAARRALALVQERQSTWTRADLLRQLAVAMPASHRTMEPAAAVALLHSVADRALAGEFEPVRCLEAPEYLALPDALRRDLDGRSVYTRPGTARYATQVQLRLEERLLAQAQREGAPSLSREDAAHLLGADLRELNAHLRDAAAAARNHAQAASGLRMDQAAALHHLLTSARTADVLVGPAGSGKTRTLAEAARAWAAAGRGGAIGLATAQAARNVLADAGVELAENTSVFLGHSPGQRGARGIRELDPGTLVLVDEASMMSMADLADIMRYAAERGCKVIVAGDQEQLAAVEGSGGMMLLAHQLGYVQLGEAVRFQQEWEQRASLRLRDGQVSALGEYDDRGRIRGGDPDLVMDEARKMYVAHHLAGTDVELIAWQREHCREMSRRIRDDLVHLGKVDASREVSLADGAKASAGDLIVCRENNRYLTTDPGHTLANGDVLRVEAVNDDGSIRARRVAGRDEETGERQFAAEAFTWRESGYRTADLGYAVTGHSAQGRTVTVGIPLVTGGETRQWLYSAMTRGAAGNYPHVFTRSAALPDPKPGTRPAPELARNERILRERAGLPPEPVEPQHRPDPREAHAVLADILARDGSEASALETQRRNLVNADHLAVLNAIWQGETSALRAERYRQAVRDALPEGYEAEKLDSPQATWLWRTMHAAETAGLDPAEVAQRALGERPLAGARDVASVIDARIREATGTMVPQAPRPWSEQVPKVADPDMQRYLTELAQVMDARKERLGEFAAEHQPAWAVNAFGPVPADPVDRLEWERRASQAAAYRELYGWDHPTEAIGPGPAGDSPEKRSAWHGAFAAMTRTDGVDLRGHSDGSLWHMRATYEAETAWAPRHVGAELRQVRTAAADMAVSAARADAEARAAREQGDQARAQRHGGLAASARAAERFYREREQADAELMADREEWARVTEGSRHLAVLADTELRRRHPGERIEPLRAAETEKPARELPEVAQPTVGDAEREAKRAAFRERLEERKGVMVPSEDPDYEPQGEAWPSRLALHRDAVLQPPKPQLRPAPEIEHAAELEAGA